MPQQPNEPPPSPPTGLEIFDSLGQGKLAQEFANAFAAVAAQVVETGKKGGVTLTLEISTRQAGDEMIQVRETIKQKIPAQPPRGAWFYALEGWIYKQDPRQPMLSGLRALEDPEPEIRTIHTEPAERRTI